MDKSKVEKFSIAELANLRLELMQSSIDSWQAAHLLTAFLAGRGYGVDSALVSDAVLRLESTGCTTDSMQAELERVALLM